MLNGLEIDREELKKEEKDVFDDSPGNIAEEDDEEDHLHNNQYSTFRSRGQHSDELCSMTSHDDELVFPRNSGRG